MSFQMNSGRILEEITVEFIEEGLFAKIAEFIIDFL